MLWYALFVIFFLWTAFTVVPVTAAAIKLPTYQNFMQGYSTTLVEIIFVFALLFAVIAHFAKGVDPTYNHLSPMLKNFHPKHKHVTAIVISLLMALCIVIVSVYLRTTMLQFFGFYEPDGFYYFSILRATINNGFHVPSVLSISGWPSHAPYTEAKGLILIPALLYAVLQYVGTSYYTAMRLSPVLFCILDMIGAYLLSRYLSRDKFFGLLVLAFVGFSMGNAARTSALIFRGDTFATFFLIIALVLFIETVRQETRNRKLIFAVLTGIALAFANFVWNGATFAVATFMFAFSILIIIAFVLRKEDLIERSKYLLLSLAVWYASVIIAHQVNFIGGQTFVDLSFIPVFLALAVLYGAVYYLTRNASMFPFLQSAAVRFFAIIIALALGGLIFTIVEPSIINNIFVANGFITTPGSFGTTIQELQPPTSQFLYTSFGTNIYTTPQTLFLMYLPTLYGFQNILWSSYAGAIGIILLFVFFIPYLFMQIYDSGDFLSGNARFRLDINVAMIVLIAYFVLTTYLQMHAIRFNSLLSVPLAILSAYTLYWIVTKVLGIFQGDATLRLAASAVCAVFFIIFFYYLLTNDNVYAQTLSQADSINPTFLQAMQWMKTNLPSNSVVLTLWPDGSVVEGVANLTAVTDSVGSQNGTKADPFAAWILGNSSDPQFLTSPLSGRPNYLLVRTPWLIETQGIFTESLINSSRAQLYGYLPLTQFTEGQLNATTRQLIFRNSPTGYPFAAVNLQQITNTSSQSTITGFIQVSPTQISRFTEVGFYDGDNGNFSLAPQPNYNQTNGEALVVTYSAVPRQGFFLNITGAYVFGPGMAQSNMVKFLYFCSSTVCIWNNNQSSMQMVYQNADSKIFKITYNN